MPNLIVDLNIDRVDLVDEGADSAAHIKLFKRKENNTAMNYDTILETLPEDQVEVVKNHVKAVVEAANAELDESVSKYSTLEKEVVELKKRLAEAEKKVVEKQPGTKCEKTDAFDEDEVIKALPQEAREYLAKAKKQAQEAEEALAKMKTKEEEELAKAKAAELDHLPVEPETLVSLCKSASPEVLDVLKKANEVLKGGAAFEELGKNAGNGANDTFKSNDAFEQIEQLAKVRSEDKGISYYVAFEQVLKEKPELYDSYLKKEVSNNG